MDTVKSIHTILILPLLLISIDAFSQTTYNSNIDPGNWTTSGTWDIAGYPQLVTDNASLDNGDSIYISSGNNLQISQLLLSNNAVIYIEAGASLTIDSLHINNNGKIYAEGQLTVLGGVSGDNNTDFVISGNVDIGGDMILGNNVDVIVDGVLNVAGNLESGNGSTLTGTGSVNVSGTVTGPFAGSSLLPVNLIKFIVSKDQSLIFITWATQSEENFDYFEIQNSNDAINFKSVGQLKGAGWSQEINQYEFIDHNPSLGINYYRLKAVDFDGYTEYFGPISIYVDGIYLPEIIITTNPVKENRLQFIYKSPEENPGQIEIISPSGKLISTKHIYSGLYEMCIPGESSRPGFYLLRLRTPKINKVYKFIMK